MLSQILSGLLIGLAVASPLEEEKTICEVDLPPIVHP